MSRLSNTTGNPPGQYTSAAKHDGITDPLIEQARIVNLAADIDRSLALRRALRPQRSDAAKRGWESRK